MLKRVLIGLGLILVSLIVLQIFWTSQLPPNCKRIGWLTYNCSDVM